MKYLLTLFVLCPIFVFAQLIEEFSDGDFMQNPSWIGNQDKFIVNDDFRLQLFDTDAGTAVLSTANSMAINCEWRFWVKLSFSPSSNNNARIYLVSDKSDLSGSPNGYFLQLGESGSMDAIELFKQNGSEITSVCRGAEGLISSSFEIGFKIIRYDNGLWKIFADPNGGDNYQPQTEGTDIAFENTQHFGFYCKYTFSNSSKFYFDDIYIGDIIIDIKPPEVVGIEVMSDSSLRITFDEAVEQSSVENPLNFLVDNDIGVPILAQLNPINTRELELNFMNKFVSGQENTIIVTSIEDLSGNVMESQQIGFMFFMAKAYDVQINEIMADPSPMVDLPEYEYLELYNSLEHNINLKDWILKIGSGEKVFDDVVIEAGGYLILAKEDALESFMPYGNFYGFSSFTLTNSAQDLILVSKEERIISEVSYTDEWYKDYEKQDGGWSIEQINPENICSGDENWRASTDNRGGSPGMINSINTDLKLLPKPIKFEMLDNRKIQFTFNQKMDSLTMVSIDNYYVDNEVGAPESIYFSEFKPQKSVLTFSEKFNEGISYEITLSKQLKNCKGDGMEYDTTIVFGIPEKPEAMDVVINEVLFNPLGNGVDFVELYNPSFKVINLAEMELGYVRISPPNPPDTSFYNISEEQFLLIPGGYICLSSSKTKVKEQYFTQNPNWFLKVDPFPNLNNDNGAVLLKTKSDTIIDALNYNEDMHYPLLVYNDGVSLERTSFLQATNDKTNWHSAAESVGFATPAYQNSQFIGEHEASDNINIDPEIFSPDNDGYNDVTSIKYKFDQPGYMMTVDIFNSNGYPVRKLVNNEYLGIDGIVNWDGIKDDNTKAAVGIYIIYIQVFDLDGNVKHFKETVVLASKL